MESTPSPTPTKTQVSTSVGTPVPNASDAMNISNHHSVGKKIVRWFMAILMFLLFFTGILMLSGTITIEDIMREWSYIKQSQPE